MALTLYQVKLSPPVRSVLMVIEAANIPDVKYVDVDLLNGDHLTEDYLKMNPQHTIPTLKDGDFVVWDSHAISIYLLTKYSNNETLYPRDPQTRAIIDQRLHFVSSVLITALRGIGVPLFFKREKSLKKELLEDIEEAYAFSEKFLTGPWMAGEEITLADLCCVSSISTMNEIVSINENLYPNLTAWFNRCKEQDFYKKGNEPGLILYGAMLKSTLKDVNFY